MTRWLLFGCLLVLGCTNTSQQRGISRSPDQEVLEKLYAAEVQKDFLAYQLKELSQKRDLKERNKGDEISSIELDRLRDEESKLQNQVDALNTKIAEYKSQSKARNHFSEPQALEVWFDQPWRQHHDEVIVHDLEEFPLYQGKPIRRISLSTSTAHTVFLQMTNYVLSWDLKKLTFRGQPLEDREFNELTTEVRCDKDIKVHGWLKATKVMAGSSYTFRWYDSRFNGAPKPLLQINDPETRCTVKFGKDKNHLNYGFDLIPEQAELAKLFSPEKKGEICFLPQTAGQSGTVKFFLDAQHKQTTCPIGIDQYKTLEDPMEGLNAKIRMLVGKDLSEEYIKKGNPLAPLDFSQAPKLDAILISYLVFRADFSGQVLMQALRYHADRGVFIRIAVSDVISLGKDRQMLFDFQAKYPNVKLLFYKYKPEGKGLKDWLNSFHRTNHIKFFMTYSASQDSANAVILGGRNIHDGFIFDQPVSNYISNTTVVKYGAKGDEAWARWEDFETLFVSRSLIHRFMGQFFAVFHADYEKFFIRPFSVVIETGMPLDSEYLNLQDDEIYLRSLVSVPFKDDMLLERTYVKLFDSAERSIKISTPYFNITDTMLAAIERAADRGVNIELITRLDLHGDTADIILSDVNKKSINKIYKRIKVYEYTTKGKILHSKLIVVDDDFVLMGSVNMNLRSFFHDIENSTMIYGKGFNRRINHLYEEYKKESRLLTEKQRTIWWKSIVINMIGTAL